jgi:hypothetical protein
MNYFTPRFMGVQAGVSFTPNSGIRGSAFQGNAGLNNNINTNNQENTARNVWGLGLNYTNDIQGVGVKASVTSELGSAASSTERDLRAYALGLNLSYAGATIGGSYGNWGKSFQLTNTAANVTQSPKDSRYWDIGASYEIAGFGASATYFTSETGVTGSQEKNLFNNVAISLDYKLAPGLTPYVEWNMYNAKLKAADSPKDRGNVFLIGTNLNF